MFIFNPPHSMFRRQQKGLPAATVAAVAAVTVSTAIPAALAGGAVLCPTPAFAAAGSRKRNGSSHQIQIPIRSAVEISDGEVSRLMTLISNEHVECDELTDPASPRGESLLLSGTIQNLARVMRLPEMQRIQAPKRRGQVPDGDLIRSRSIDLRNGDAQVPARSYLTQYFPNITLLPLNAGQPTILMVSGTDDETLVAERLVGDRFPRAHLTQIRVKGGVFLPQKSSSGDTPAVGGGRASGELELGLTNQQGFTSGYFNATRFSIGYMETKDSRLIPLTLSQIHENPAVGSTIIAPYFGYGLGMYLARYQTDEERFGDHSLFGGYVVVGAGLSSRFFAEAKYHIISRYGGRSWNGPELMLGFRLR